MEIVFVAACAARVATGRTGAGEKRAGQRRSVPPSFSTLVLLCRDDLADMGTPKPSLVKPPCGCSGQRLPQCRSNQ